ncbi:hypothetical protein FRB95_003358 [Tulasnella sp. JGI-2019a]|nr:hypothetical protein FRB95_003358 [Tulasnella sp. JGI-2019a]
MPDHLPQAFWTWLENQKNLRELKLPGSCNPSIIPLDTIPKLEALGASPNVARILVPNRSIRAFDGIGYFYDTTSPTWSLEDLEYVLSHLGPGLQSIGRVKVSRQNVASFLRLIRKWCPFTKTIYCLIECQDISVPDAPGAINLEDLVSALHGFQCLRNFYLTVDYKSTEEAVREMIEEIAKDCPMLSFVKWTSTISSYDAGYPNEAYVFAYELVGGLWSCVERPRDGKYPIVRADE